MMCIDKALSRMATIAGVFFLGSFLSPAQAATHGKDIALQNEFVSVRYHQQAGTMDIVWKDGHKLLGITSGARLEDGHSLSTTAYAAHSLDPAPDSNTVAGMAGSREYTIRSTAPNMPVMLQHIWLYDGKPEIAIDAELSSEAGTIGTRHLDAIMLKGANAVQ